MGVRKGTGAATLLSYAGRTASAYTTSGGSGAGRYREARLRTGAPTMTGTAPPPRERGAITGVVGGAVRDVLCGETPMILRQDIYATAAVAGATTYVVLIAWAGPGAITLTASIAVTLLLRLSAIRFDLNLPTQRPKE